MKNIIKKNLNGWGEYKSYSCNFFQPNDINDLKLFLKELKKDTKIIVRGHGCSSGDQAVNKDGVVIDFSKINKILKYDCINKIITVEAGVKLSTILSKTLKDNLILESVPGGLEITVAGAVVNNVHGKDCFKNGYFKKNVTAISILQRDGKIIKLSKTTNVELFDNFFGSCGLLGMIINVEIQLKSVPSNSLKVETKIANNIDEMKNYFENLNLEKDFAIAWLDCNSKKENLMRGIFRTATFIDETKLTNKEKMKQTKRAAKFLKERKENLFMNFFLLVVWRFFGLIAGSKIFKILNPIAFNLVKNFKNNDISKKTLPEFLGIANNYLPSYNYLFKPNGHLTIQPFFDKFEKIKEVIEICHEFRILPIWCPIKKYKLQKKNPLEFGDSGYSIVIEFSPSEHGTETTKKFIQALHTKIEEQGGRFYLAKDEIIDSAHFKKTYPEYNKFLEIKKRYDPETLFVSEQFKRLFN
jgi:decaprenylphospho-beta-D-ribofuranose 2-oxidase